MVGDERSRAIGAADEAGAAPGSTPLGSLDTIETTETNHDRILAVCVNLELLADSLPSTPKSNHHLVVARRMGPLLRSAHAFEEQVFFPLVTARLGAEGLSHIIATLTEEHRHDEAFAEEVSEILLEWLVGDRRHSPETLGYMLRGLFDNLRRHIAREREHLVEPLSRQIRPRP